VEMERDLQGFDATRIGRIPLGILKVLERPDPLLEHHTRSDSLGISSILVVSDPCKSRNIPKSDYRTFSLGNLKDSATSVKRKNV